ncbi:DUF460 domain-containing protein [Candidatus Woesearchaeota archaeon]|nr:DUF460 domain-containing protein [Candidatus Woesearchaeota archaeon]
MMKETLFIGIDPGTTSAYAVLDAEGNVKKVHSCRELGIADILRDVISMGIPIAVGTDKEKVPELIRKFSVNTGSRIVSAGHDLGIGEKKRMVRGFSYSNAHEMDALASAILAFNKYRSLLSRIRSYARSNSKQEAVNELFVYAIRDGMPVRKAAELIEDKDEEAKIVKKAIRERKFTKKDFIKLYEQLAGMRKENSLIREYNSELRNKTRDSEKEIKRLSQKHTRKKRLDSGKIDSLFRFKDKRINELNNEISEMRRENDRLEQEVSKLCLMLSGIGGKYLLKKLRNLGIGEFEAKRKIFGIKEGDLLLVEDANIYNEKVIGMIKGKVKAIICRRKPNKKTGKIKIAFLPADGLEIEENEHFAAVGREELDNRLQKKNILNNIIEDYKEGRK